MWIECVPNVSEGRDRSKIEAIAAAIRAVSGVSLLNIDPGVDANRTVYTFVGERDAVLEASYQMFREAASLIDMRHQNGAHPRIGAVDVVPFVPLPGAEMAECIACARALAERVAREFGVPIFLYEEAATSSLRENLSAVRRGEYEGLEQKLKLAEWAPDFGPPVFNPKLGASAIGARKFLIAFNVNLTTDDVRTAREIASRIRTAGAPSESRLAACKAIGWHMPSFACAQVSMNLVDFEKTGLIEAFRACRREARALGCDVAGSELVGLVPIRALFEAGWEIEPGASEESALLAAVKELGLDRFKPFKPEERVIELITGRR